MENSSLIGINTTEAIPNYASPDTEKPTASTTIIAAKTCHVETQQTKTPEAKPLFRVIRPKDVIKIQSHVPCLSVKLDAVYKPILRRFRGYFRDRFDNVHSKKSYMHWTTENYIQQIRAFMVDELALPEPLMCDANIVKMLTLIFPCTTRRPLPNLTERVDRILFA